MILFYVVLAFCFVLLTLLYFLSRDIKGGKTIEEWGKNDRVCVPRQPFHLIANGWYTIIDVMEYTEPLDLERLGRKLRIQQTKKSEFVVTDEHDKSYDVDVYCGMVMVWFHAENMPPSYKIGDFHPDPSKYEDFVYHGKMVHEVSCLLQDVPENGADYAHFKAVHETGTLGSIGDIIGFKIIFKGTWDVIPEHPVCAKALVDNHAQIFGMDLEFTKQRVVATQIGPSVVVEGKLNLLCATFFV